MSTNDFASCSDAGNRSGELGGVTKTGSGGTPELGSGSGDEREHENSSDSRTELAADVSSRNEDKGEGRAERYGDARHSDGLLSPIVLGHQLAGQDLASGNVSATFEPVLHSEVLSSQHRGVNSAIETKVRSGSGLFSSQRLASSTTKVEAKLSAPLPPESRLEGAFESSASLFEAIKESSGAIKESSGAVIESPKRVIGKPEDGQPGLNGDHGDRSTPTKTLKKARGVELELNRAAFTPLGCIGPRQRHENHLSGGSLKTPSLKSGPVQGLEYESAGPTSAEHRVHLSGMAKADAAAVMKYLSKPSRDAGSSHTLSSHDNQSRATPDDGPAINGPVTTTLHEYNAQNIANDIERYRMAGFPYPGPEYFSLAPPSGPFHTRPYQREAGVYCREFNGRGPRSRRSTQGQSQRSPPVIGGVASFEEVSGPSFMFSPESPASPVPRPFHGEAERYRAQFVGRQLNSRRPAQGQSPRSPPIVQAFNGSRDGIDARISSLSAESPTLEALRPFHIEAAGHRSGQPRMSKASRYRGKSQSNQSCVGDDTRPKLPTQEAPLSSTQQQPQQQQPQAGAPSATQTQLNITRLSMPPATLPAINASAATYAAPHADNMGLTFVPLLSESYLQQLRMMHTTGGQIPLANAPPSQTEKTSSDLSIRHLARPIQAQTPDARVPRALHFAQGSFITMHAKSSQSQLAKAPSTQAQNASSGQNTHSEHSLSLLNMADAPFEPPSNPHQTHLASARALIARLPSALPSTQGPSSTINPRGLQSQFAEEPSTQARNASSAPSKPHRAHVNDARALAARIPRALTLALPSAQGPSTQQQEVYNTSSGQRTRSEHSSLLFNMANTQADSSNLQLGRPHHPQTDGARVPDASPPAQDPSTRLQPARHFSFSFPPGAIMPGSSAPYTWHHRGTPPPLPNPANINDPTTQLSLYERHIANVLSPKVTVLITDNTAVFVPIINARNKCRMVLQELPALTPKYCDEFGKFTLRLNLTIRGLLQLHLSGYYAAIRIMMVRDLEMNRILLFNKVQERIRLEGERLGEQMERNGAVLSALRQLRPPAPSPRSGDEVIVAPAPPSTPSQHSSSAPSMAVRLSTCAREAGTADTSAQQGTPTRPPVRQAMISPPVRLKRPPSKSAEERAEMFRAALARNGVRASGETT